MDSRATDGGSIKASTEDLIRSLESDLKPAEPLRPYWQQLLIWGALSLVTNFLIVRSLGDHFHIEWDFWYLAELGLLALTVVFSALMAILSSRPGWGRQYYRLLIGFISLWAIALFVQFYNYPKINWSAPLLSHLFSACGGALLLLSLIPSGLLFFMARKGATTTIGWTSLFVGFAGAGLGFLMMKMACIKSDPLHVILAHVVPVLLLVVIGQFIGRRFLKW